jgi:hypothetical protein
MKLIIEKEMELPLVNVGDILEFERFGGEFTHYLVCHSKKDGYFIVNLTGEKSKIHYYESIEKLVRNQRNLTNTYSMTEYALVLRKLEEDEE